jgi:ABC-type sugar transport system permease subunit
VFKIFDSQQPLRQGAGAVMAIGLFGLTLIVSVVQFTLLERRVHYGR